MRYFWMLCTMFIGFALQAQESIDEKEEVASAYLDNGNFEEAAKRYEELLKMDHNNAYLLSQCGLCYFYLDSFEKCKEKFRLAVLYGDVNDSETMASYYTNLCAAYSNLNQDEEAYEYAMKAYQLDKTQLWNAASMAQNISRYDECLKLMNDAENAPLNNVFHSLYGKCYYSKKQYKRAMYHYRTFLENYDAEDELSVRLNLKDQENYYLYSSLSLLGETIEEGDQDEIINEIVSLLKRNSNKEEDMIAAFLGIENICDMYGMNASACEKLFHAVVTKPTQKQEILATFYSIKNYQKANWLAGEYLARNAEESPGDIKQIQFLSALQLYTINKDNLKKDLENGDLKALLQSFDLLLRTGESYSDEKFESTQEISNLLDNMVRIFKRSYPTYLENNDATPLMLRFIRRVPNEESQNQLIQMLAIEYE